MSKSKVYKVFYTRLNGGEGSIIVKAQSKAQALKNADYLCFTGSGFHDPVEVSEDEYQKPRRQGFFGSHRA